jgi:hypothetical protein
MEYTGINPGVITPLYAISKAVHLKTPLPPSPLLQERGRGEVIFLFFYINNLNF